MSLAASERAIISASQDETATQFCFREPQTSGAFCQKMTHPDVEFLMAQSESE